MVGRLLRAIGPIVFGAAALASTAPVVSGQAHTGVIVGVVTSLPTRQPLAGALIEIAGTTHRATTDSGGNFRVADLPVGDVTVEGRAIGFEAVALVVSIAPDSTVRVRVEFRPLVVELRGIVVDGSALSARETRLKGFHDRRAAGFGRFVTREEIERRDVRDSKELLRGIPGVRVVGNRIQMTTAQTRGCVVQYFVDGLHIVGPSSDILTGFRPRDVEGIEVYRGPAETPLTFSRGGAECGVIAIWTRLGGRP